MKKYILSIAAMAMSVMMMAVPARRGFHEYQQADGSKIELQLMGDEFYHYLINRDGKQVREVNGMYQVVGDAPTAEVAKARRAKAVARRQRKDVGTTPNLAPKGVVILVNYKDKAMQSGHTKTVFDELCNSTSCTVNKYNGVNYGSAAQYFADQSNGTYRPVFDVFGPVTLSQKLDHYGHNIDAYGNLTDESSENTEDKYATDAVIEACIKANQQYDINFKDYDSDNDGYVDFVYVIYAGKGEADGGAANTIWPHNYSIQSVLYYAGRGEAFSEYSKSDTKLDGVYLDNYAMSSELSGSALCGIGTLCHEFGHVIGLPDLYDIEYGSIYEACKTPNDWNIMDGGSYNADGHCPPNYDPWQKDFFGWLTPINLGNEGQNVTLYANGTANYQTYQINASGTYVSPTTSGVRYYIENRQAQGWDAPLTGHGMLIWKINFNETAWINNAPNASSTSGAPLYTIVSATGTKIGQDGDNDNCPKNTFPGSGKKTSYTGISGKPLLNIAETNGVITLTYIEEPVTPVDPFEITWMANGQEFAKTTSTGKIVLPETEPAACTGKVFVGWCKQAEYNSETTAPDFVSAGQTATEGDIFYAVFATENESANVPVNDVLTLATTGVSGTNYTEWSGKKLSSTAIYAGQSAGGNSSIQLRSNSSNSGIITTASGGKVEKIVVDWNSNTSSGRTLDIYGKNSPYSSPTDLYGSNDKGTKLGSIVMGTSTELTVTGDYTNIGMRSNTGAMYLNSVTVTWSGGGTTYSGYTTTPSDVPSAIDNTLSSQPAAVKAIRDGQVVIIRGDKTYSILGVQQ